MQQGYSALYEEFKYCLDICHVTLDAHTEHLQTKLQFFSECKGKGKIVSVI